MKNVYKKGLASLVVAGCLLTFNHGMGVEASAAEKASKTISTPAFMQMELPQKAQLLAADDYDIAKNWQVLHYKSKLNIPLDKIFLQDVESKSPTETLKQAYVNFANIDATFKAQRVFKFKKNHTYNLKWYYGIRTTGKAVATVDFNGTKKTVANAPNVRNLYEEKIVAKEDMEYVVTMEFTAPKVTNVFLMVGRNIADSDNGIVDVTVEKPTVTQPEAGDTVLKGKAESGNTIRAYNEAQEVIGEGKVAADNSFMVGIDHKLKHNEKVFVTQTNSEGLESDPTEVTAKDTIAPEAPKAEDVEFTKQIASGSAETNAKIIIRDKNGDIVGQGIANNSVVNDTTSTFSIKLAKEMAVDETLNIVAVDEAGDVSPNTTVKVVDNSVPEAPQVDAITDQDSTLTGKGSKPGSKIEVKIGDQKFEGTVENDKTFSIDLKRQFPGATKITVVEIDKNQKRSEETVVTVKGTVKTAVPQVNTVGDSDKQLTGTAEANANIQVTINGAVYTGKADEKGNFVIQLNRTYPEGTEGSVIATGNSGIESDAATFTITDTTAPEAPAVAVLKDDERTFTGKTEKGATVRVTFSDKDKVIGRYETVADANGDFSIKLDNTYKAGTIIETTATDKANNTSPSVKSKVLSSTELEVELLEITSQDESADGQTSRPNSYYQVKIGDRVYEGYSDDNGEFTIDFNRTYEVGLPVTVFAKDADDRTEVAHAVVMPRHPTSISPRNGDSAVSGQLDPGAKVTLTVNGNDKYETTADADGNFIINLNTPLDFGDIVNVTSVVNNITSSGMDVMVF